MKDDPFVYQPGLWDDPSDHLRNIENRTERKALALIRNFGTPGGGDKVAFVGDFVVIASPPASLPSAEIELVVRRLSGFVDDYTARVQREVSSLRELGILLEEQP